MERAKAPIYLFEDIRVDVNRLKVERGGQPVDLEPKALRVLIHLIEHRGRVVPKDELIAEIWDGAFVTDNAVTRVIAQIRKQLGDQARSPRFIETAATAGYRFIPELTERTVAPGASARRLTTTLVATAAVVLLMLWWTRRAPPSVGSPLKRIEQITSSAAADLWPSFSPDGTELAYSSNRSGHFEIYTRSLSSTGVERQITTDGQDNIQPAWSPDGKYLAFVAKVRGGIGLIPLTGGPTRYLTDSGSDPHWSPDGRTLVYRSTNVKTVREASGTWNSTLFLVDRDGSAPRVLTRPSSPRGGHNFPRWLPDGRHVIFAAPGETAAQAPWIVDTQTGSLDHMVEMGMNVVSFPSFSKSSAYLYFVGAGRREPMGLWRVRVGRGWTTQPPEAMSAATVAWPRDLTISADGTRLAFSQEMVQSAIWSVPIDASGVETGAPIALTQGHSLRDSSPVFSPDGSRLAYTSSRQGSNVMVMVANADGTATVPISPPGQNSFDPDWFGKELVCGYVTSVGHSGEYVLSALQGPPKPLNTKFDFDKVTQIRVSPDGTRLVAHFGTPDNYQLVVEDLRLGTQRTITPAGRSIGFPAWSPDGRWIAAQERVQNVTRLVIVPADGGEIQTLVNDPVESWAHSWSPDGERIAFAGLRDGVWNIYWVSRSTRQVHQLTHFTSQSSFVRYPTWSPKNNQVAFEYNAFEANIYVGDLR